MEAVTAVGEKAVQIRARAAVQQRGDRRLQCRARRGFGLPQQPRERGERRLKRRKVRRIAEQEP